MRFDRLPLVAATTVVAIGIGSTALPNLVKADTTLIDGLTLRAVTRIMSQYTLLAARTMVDLTYDQLAVDPHTGDVAITGFKLYPRLDWDQDRSCVVEIGRVASAKETGFEVIESLIELTGVIVAPSCFPGEQAAMKAAFGYNGLTIDNLSIEMSYEFGSSAADLTIHASVQDAAAVTVTAAFDYVWITGLIPDADNPDGEPYPVGLLSEAEIAIENRGIFERVEPMLARQLGDVNAVPQMIAALLMDALSEGGSRSLNAAETDFINNVADEVWRFIAEKNRVVLSVAPPGGVWLSKATFESPGTAIAALRPVVSAAPLVSRALIAPAELLAAINGQAIETWTIGGLGGQIATLYGIAQ